MDEEKGNIMQSLENPPEEAVNQGEGGEMEDEDLDDLDDLGMFHKSSLKEK